MKTEQRNRSPLTVALLTAALLSCYACGDSPSAGAAAGPVRLGDLLDTASIESPLLTIAAAASMEALGGVPREIVLEEDFEDFDPAAAGWASSSVNTVEESGEGHAFVLRDLGRGRYGWVVEAEPGTHYVFERSVRTELPLDADFAVVEAKSMGKLGTRGVFDRHYMAGRGQALKIHYPQRPKAFGVWQRGTLSVFTTPQTRSIAVVLRPTVSRHDVVHSEHEVAFDEIRLARVDPTPEQAMALLKARAPSDGSDPELGIEKFGQFPPLGDVGEEHGPADDNFSYRYALYAPPPTDLGFTVRVPADATLYWSTSLSRETRAGERARFEVIVRTTGGGKTVAAHSVGAVPGEWQWHDRRADLSAFAGKQVEIVLRTRAEVGHPHPVWGNPVIDVPPSGDGPNNVILIAVDTLRADRLSSYGYEKATSPHLDALARDGVRFDQVASNCNWTCPSFASILTGTVPARHGVHSYGPRTPLPSELETLAERFRADGWVTQSIIYKPPLYDGGFEQGFDVAFNVPREAVRASDNLTEAMEWLDAHAGRRNFLFLHFNDPHQPFTQPDPWDQKFGEDPAEHDIELPHSIYQSRGKRGEEFRDLMRSLYDGEVAYVDDRIGAFLSALKERGLYEDAVIGFVSDHGEQLWEHGGFGHGPNFTSGAGLLYDEVIRVPLIVKPGRGDFVRGGVVAAQVRGFDVMPTLLELAGIPAEHELDAESLLPFLSRNADEPMDRVAVIESSGRSVAVRNRTWKYILTPPGRRAAKERLFNLATDPDEQEDVAEAHADVVDELRTQVLDYYLLRRPGRYLVAIGSAEERQFKISGATVASVLFGLPGRSVDGAWKFEGEAAGPLLTVAVLQGDAAVVAAAGSDPVSELRRYQAGDLACLLDEAQPGFYLFEGPPRIRGEASLQTMDARQLEALRSLGYVGEERDQRR